MLVRSLFIGSALLLSFALLPWVSSSSQIHAQEVVYTEDPIDEKLLERTADREITEIHSKGSKDTAFSIAAAKNRNKYKKYFENLVFAKMTQASKLDSLNTLSQQRLDFFKGKYTDAGKKYPEAFKYLNKLTLEKMEEIAGDKKYHPAARHNAVIVIGMLDQAFAKPPAPAIPHWDAIKTLTKFATDKNQHSTVRVAALGALLRHATAAKTIEASDKVPTALKLPAAQKSSIAKAMVEIITEEESTAMLSKDGKAWMMMQAAQVLGQLQEPGTGNVNLKALAALSANQNIGATARTAAAKAIGELNLINLTGIDAKKLCGDFGQAAMAVINDEQLRSKQAGKSVSASRIRHGFAEIYFGLAKTVSRAGVNQQLYKDLASALRPIINKEETVDNASAKKKAAEIKSWLLAKKLIVIKKEVPTKVDESDKIDKKPITGEGDLFK